MTPAMTLVQTMAVRKMVTLTEKLWARGSPLALLHHRQAALCGAAHPRDWISGASLSKGQGC